MRTVRDEMSMSPVRARQVFKVVHPMHGEGVEESVDDPRSGQAGLHGGVELGCKGGVLLDGAPRRDPEVTSRCEHPAHLFEHRSWIGKAVQRVLAGNDVEAAVLERKAGVLPLHPLDDARDVDAAGRLDGDV